MPVRVNENEFVQNWENGMVGSADKAARGVDRVTQAPGKAAAAQKSVWLQNIQSSADRWATNVGNVTLEDWRNAYKQKGIPAMQNAIPLAKNKVMAAAGKLLSTLKSLDASAPKRGATIDQNLQRVAHFAKGLNRAFKG